MINPYQKELSMTNDSMAIQNAMITAEEMDRDYGHIMLKAARSVGLEYNLCLDVKQEVMFDFYTRRPGRFNPARASLSSFLWIAARSKALDFKRKMHDGRLSIVEDTELLSVCDAIHCKNTTVMVGCEEAKMILCEALRRLYCGVVSEKQIRIFAMYVVAKMERETVAALTGERGDYVSLVKNRLYGKFLAHLEDIEREDLEGRLKLSAKSIAFLKPILPFLL